MLLASDMKHWSIHFLLVILEEFSFFFIYCFFLFVIYNLNFSCFIVFFAFKIANKKKNSNKI